jgi:hypothetical protein
LCVANNSCPQICMPVINKNHVHQILLWGAGKKQGSCSDLLEVYSFLREKTEERGE